MHDDVAPANVPHQRLVRVIYDQLDADRGGEVKAPIRLTHQLGDELGVVSRALNEAATSAAHRYRQVLSASSAQVVEGDDDVTPRNKRIGQVRADKASPPGY